MINCLKSELKTYFHLRMIIICLIVLMVIPIMYFCTGYQSVTNQIAYDQDVLNDVFNYVNEVGSEEIDCSDLTNNLLEIYRTYHPDMAFNNSLGIFLGIALIIFPVISAWYMGREYGKSRPIKQKIAFYSLPKVFAAKITVLVIITTGFTAIYALLCYSIANQKWPSIFTALSSTDIVSYEAVRCYTALDNAKLFCVVIAVLMFYSCFTLFLAGLFKGSSYGVIGVLVINYVVIPSKFAPHNVIYAMINNTFYTSSISPYAFTQNQADPLSIQHATLLFALYFIILLGANFVLSLRQRNY